MRRITRWISVLCCAVLCGAGLSLSVSAIGGERVYELTQEGNTYTLTQKAGDPCFWEAPDMRTGQSRMDGKILFRNKGDREADFTLTNVSLPYDNEAALRYLDYLTIRISDEGGLLYQGAMTTLMDAERPPIAVKGVAPGAEAALTVSVSCAYAYTDAVPSYSSLTWTFQTDLTAEAPAPAVTEPAALQEIPAQDGWIQWTVLFGFSGCTVLVIVLLTLVIRTGRRNQKKARKGA